MLYTIKEVCELLKISRATFYREVAHQMRPTRVGKRWRYSQREVDRFISRNTLKSAADVLDRRGNGFLDAHVDR